MLYYADLHIHSKYSRAVSDKMDLEHVAAGAREKGLSIMGTGDFTHPLWFKEIKEKLVESPEHEGLFALKGAQDILFMLTAEVSTIISTPRGVKKVHHVIHAPSLEVAAQLNDVYTRLGNLQADGRPTFGGCSPAGFAEKTMAVSRDIALVPAHAWTPWFSVFGSMSGFNSLDEAFEEQARHVFAIETGMSSDPAMNWRVSSLDKISLMSNSDSHSPYPWRLGRECNAFEFSEKELSFASLFKAVREKDAARFRFTVEVDPGYGKYHFDGHRVCKFSSSPEETKRLKGVCPVCRRRLTVGVLNRVEELADASRPLGFKPRGAIPFKTLLPLHELLAACYSSTLASKRVMELGARLTKECGNELRILLEASREELERFVDPKVADLVLLNREGKLHVRPGFDGEYGVLELRDEEKCVVGGAREKTEKERPMDARGQKSLSEY